MEISLDREVCDGEFDRASNLLEDRCKRLSNRIELILLRTIPGRLGVRSQLEDDCVIHGDSRT